MDIFAAWDYEANTIGGVAIAFAKPPWEYTPVTPTGPGGLHTIALRAKLDACADTARAEFTRLVVAHGEKKAPR